MIEYRARAQSDYRFAEMQALSAIVFVLTSGLVFSDLASFREFKAQFGKHYSNQSEESSRYDIYSVNLERIEAHNQSPGSTYRMGMNQFGDWTFDEFLSWFTTSTIDPISGSTSSRMQLQESELGAIQESVDWAAIGAITIRNQQTCRSNYAQISAAAIQSSWAIRNGELILPSSQQLIDCTRDLGNDGCRKGDVQIALSYAMNGSGLCPAETYPFTGRSSDLCHDNRCPGLIRIKSFQFMQRNNETSLKLAVFTQPIISFISINDPGIMFYSSGVYNGICSGDATHAIVIVGYGTNVDTGELYWKIGNTWGNDWGEDGYMRISRSSSSDSPGRCSIATNPIYIQAY